MRKDEFERYLKDQGLDKGTIASYLSNCRCVEKYERDLDKHFDDDRMDDLIDRLSYSAEDKRSGRSPRHKIPIDVDVQNVSATLKRATNSYRKFRLEGDDSVRERRRAPVAPFQEAIGFDHLLNTILYGPPGTGKTYATARRCVDICDGTVEQSSEDIRHRYDVPVEERSDRDAALFRRALHPARESPHPRHDEHRRPLHRPARHRAPPPLRFRGIGTRSRSAERGRGHRPAKGSSRHQRASWNT